MTLVLAIGLLIGAIGAVGVITPEGLGAISRYTITPLGLYLAAAVRVAIGIILIRAAPTSRLPRVLRVLGIIAVVAGVITVFLGVDRASTILAWWSGQGPLLIRLWPALALIFGVVLVYSAVSNRRAA